jgi:hypothetical protein
MAAAWFEFRPLTPWLGPVTPAHERRSSSTFRVSWDDTLKHLRRETAHLKAGLVVIEVDVRAGELRLDGALRANAVVGFPGVRVSFESKHGPLQYSTDAYDRWGGRGLTGWQANVRAIALGLGALRAVDRYGITRTGEQYRGWTAIAARPAEMTPEQAAEFIVHWSAPEGVTPPVKAADIVSPTGQVDQEALRRAYRAAAARTHGDRTGDHDTMARLNAARDLILGRNQ